MSSATRCSLELATVDGDHGLREKLHLSAQLDETAADVANAGAVVTTEVGDGLEVWCEAACEPHQLEIALALTLEPTGGLHSVEVAVDVDLEQDGWVVRRPARLSRLCSIEAQGLQVQFLDKRVDDAHCVVVGDEVVQRLGKQRDLVPVLAFDEPWHIDLLLRYAEGLYAVTSIRGPGFSHSLAA